MSEINDKRNLLVRKRSGAEQLSGRICRGLEGRQHHICGVIKEKKGSLELI